MGNARTDAIRQGFIAARTELQQLDALTRDLTDDERARSAELIQRMDAAEANLTEIQTRQRRLDAVAGVTADLVRSEDPGGDPANPIVRRSREYDAGEYVQNLVRMGWGNLGKEGYRQYAGDPETLQRVVAHGVSADATSPVTIEGDLVAFVDSNRYAITRGARQLPLPDNRSETFKRPRLTQRTTVGQQMAEGDVLSSQRFQVTGDTVTKGTWGGTVSLSEQSIAWSDPALLGLVVNDLAGNYAEETDAMFCTAVEAASLDANKTVVSLTAAPDVFNIAIAEAIVKVYGLSKKVADTLYVSLSRWAYLASLTDGDGRLVFPIVNPVNAAGTNTGGVFTGMNVMGLNVVCDPAFTNGYWSVGVSSLAEFYEENRGLLQANIPSTLELSLSYRGFAAANIYSAGFSPLKAA